MKISRQLLQKYNQQAPRYTSYPPAPFFTESFSQKDYIEQLERSNSEEPENISLYVHIPFCSKICTFCGCNTIRKPEETETKYVDALIKEIENCANHIDQSRPVSQIHWGGGTPHAISKTEIERIMEAFNKHFSISENAEIAMECNPAYWGTDFVYWLKKTGFNRLSLGIQDFSKDVLKLINRDPSQVPVKELVAYIKTAGFDGVNLDFVYGLPGQTVDSFAETIDMASKCKPDRFAIFSYAHVPWVKPMQKVLEKHSLPSPEEKLQMLENTNQILTEAGYNSIGMDHFAMPEDALSQAFRDKQLHRNFQGYCTKETTGQVYAFGASGISQLSSSYSQNCKSTYEYIDRINTKGFACERGYILNKEEKICRTAINELMCNLQLDFSELAKEFNINPKEVKQITGFQLNKIETFINDNLLTFENDKIKVNQEGAFFIRNIAMQFDPKLAEKKGMYSKTI